MKFSNKATPCLGFSYHHSLTQAAICADLGKAAEEEKERKMQPGEGLNYCQGYKAKQHGLEICSAAEN